MNVNVLIATNAMAVMPRVKRGIQYAAARRIESRDRGLLDRPVKPGEDTLLFLTGFANHGAPRRPTHG